MSISSIIKDSDAVLDYGFDWSDWLADGETISASSWTVSTGIIEDSNTNTTTTTTIWLSGGTINTTYRVINEIVTNLGRTDNRSIDIRVRNR